MCLATRQKEPLIAEEDIIVYKIFGPDNRSLYFEFDYSPYIGKRFDNSELESIIKRDNHTLIYGGFIHSYTGIGFALSLIYYLNLNRYKEKGAMYIIRECKIPKGSKYYKDNKNGEIASKSIIIGDIAYG